MTGTAQLFPGEPSAPVKQGVLADLDVRSESYERVAAQRIAALVDLRQVDAVLLEVPRHFVKTVMTLAIGGIALRIAQMPRLLDRRDALDLLPTDIRARAEPLVKSWFQTRPWTRKASR